MTKTATQRDVTIIKTFAAAILEWDERFQILRPVDHDRLKVIVAKAQAIDARTGRRDPSVRKSAAKSGVGRKAKA